MLRVAHSHSLFLNRPFTIVVSASGDAAPPSDDGGGLTSIALLLRADHDSSTDVVILSDEISLSSSSSATIEDIVIDSSMVDECFGCEEGGGMQRLRGAYSEKDRSQRISLVVQGGGLQEYVGDVLIKSEEEEEEHEQQEDVDGDTNLLRLEQRLNASRHTKKEVDTTTETRTLLRKIRGALWSPEESVSHLCRIAKAVFDLLGVSSSNSSSNEALTIDEDVVVEAVALLEDIVVNVDMREVVRCGGCRGVINAAISNDHHSDAFTILRTDGAVEGINVFHTSCCLCCGCHGKFDVFSYSALTSEKPGGALVGGEGEEFKKSSLAMMDPVTHSLWHERCCPSSVDKNHHPRQYEPRVVAPVPLRHIRSVVANSAGVAAAVEGTSRDLLKNIKHLGLSLLAKRAAQGTPPMDSDAARDRFSMLRARLAKAWKAFNGSSNALEEEL